MSNEHSTEPLAISKNPAPPVNTGSGTLSTDALLSQLWSEHAQRHGVFWSTYWRWAAFLLSIEVLPYINEDIREALGQWVLMLPIASAIGVVFLGLLLYSEYKRVTMTDRWIEAIRGKPPQIPEEGLGRIWRMPIGLVVIWYLVVAVFLTSAANLLVLQQLLCNHR